MQGAKGQMREFCHPGKAGDAHTWRKGPSGLWGSVLSSVHHGGSPLSIPHLLSPFKDQPPYLHTDLPGKRLWEDMGPGLWYHQNLLSTGTPPGKAQDVGRGSYCCVLFDWGGRGGRGDACLCRLLGDLACPSFAVC